MDTETTENIFKDVKIHQDNISTLPSLAERVSVLEKQYQLKPTNASATHTVTAGDAAVSGFSVDIYHNLGYRPKVSGSYYTDYDNIRHMLPSSTMATVGGGATYYDIAFIVQVEDIDTEKATIWLRATSLAGYGALLFYVGTTFTFELDFLREKTA